MGAPIVHFEVRGRDFGRTKEFYGSLFNWKIDDVPSMPYATVDTGVRMGINGGLSQSDDEGMPFSTFYVQVKHPQAVLDKAVGLGGRVIVPLTEIPGMVTFALFADPDGCIVGLIEGPESLTGEGPRHARRKARRKAAKKSTPRTSRKKTRPRKR